jgi:hypothetical protein
VADLSQIQVVDIELRVQKNIGSVSDRNGRIDPWLDLSLGQIVCEHNVEGSLDDVMFRWKLAVSHPRGNRTPLA